MNTDEKEKIGRRLSAVGGHFDLGEIYPECFITPGDDDSCGNGTIGVVKLNLNGVPFMGVMIHGGGRAREFFDFGEN